jgi:N-acetylmuramoyl-L-alanine amidase
VAYAQSAKETGYGNFGGVIDPSFRNPCGLKTTAGGSDSDPDAHQRFTTWRQGITACIDHLALYAGAPGYPRPSTPDPRHFPSIRGTARTVERLGAAWAPAPDYGLSIVRDYLTPLLES